MFYGRIFRTRSRFFTISFTLRIFWSCRYLCPFCLRLEIHEVVNGVEAVSFRFLNSCSAKRVGSVGSRVRGGSTSHGQGRLPARRHRQVLRAACFTRGHRSALSSEAAPEAWTALRTPLLPPPTLWMIERLHSSIHRRSETPRSGKEKDTS